MGKDQLVFKTSTGFTYIAEKEYGQPKMQMDHLACFMAGNLMLGSRTLPNDEVDPSWEVLAEELTETCFQFYNRTASGLSAEFMVFDQKAAVPFDMKVPDRAPFNILRPEAAEALFYMWYYTGKSKYQDMARQIFLTFNA